MLADFLSVGEVAGVVIDGLYAGESGGGFEEFSKVVRVEEFGEVLGLFANSLKVLTDDLSVFFESGAATGGVYDDGKVWV